MMILVRFQNHDFKNQVKQLENSLSMLAVSVEVLVPWDLWSIELWEEWIHEDVEHELEWQLTDEVECKWQAHWVHEESGRHHNVIVKSKSLVSNEKLLKIYEDLEPCILISILNSEAIEECWE